jgi:hypothetical protein
VPRPASKPARIGADLKAYEDMLDAAARRRAPQANRRIPRPRQSAFARAEAFAASLKHDLERCAAIQAILRKRSSRRTSSSGITIPLSLRFIQGLLRCVILLARTLFVGALVLLPAVSGFAEMHGP